jgi:GTP cyclohydrolase I
MATKKISAKSVSKVVANKNVSVRPVKTAAPKKSDSGTPLSVVIRRRIEAQKARFHANDNMGSQ